LSVSEIVLRDTAVSMVLMF